MPDLAPERVWWASFAIPVLVREFVDTLFDVPGDGSSRGFERSGGVSIWRGAAFARFSFIAVRLTGGDAGNAEVAAGCSTHGLGCLGPPPTG